MATTQIFFASTLYGAATLAAAIDSDCFAPAGRRLLLVSNNAATPETTPSLDEMPGFERLRDRFDRVLSWNEALAPFHPGAWSPRTDDIPLWERHLRLLWGLGDDTVELVVESIQVNPALALTQLFTDAPIDVYADGLMSYGPTRNKIDPLVGTRVRRLLHLDLVPGLTPLLLGEFGVPPEVVPTESFLKVLGELSDGEEELSLPAGSALLLGQYLSALSILTAEEEEDLHVAMLRGAVDRGHRQIVFKPHPTAPARWSRLLEREAQTLGVELTVLDSPVLAEVVYQRLRPALVVGCFSTALLTASTFYSVPVARTGTDLLLERLSPYQNSNRVPSRSSTRWSPAWRRTARTPARPTWRACSRRSASRCSRTSAVLRPAAERFLAQHLRGSTWRYFKRRRLTTLALPGRLPKQFGFIPRNAALRRVVRRARSLKRAALRRAVTG